jgi:cobalt-zinc-cadmium efflux system outer membrane protein
MYRQAIALSVGLCLCIRLAPSQQPSSASTADQLVEAAIARNREFSAFNQRIAEAQGQLRQAGVRPAPEIQIQTAGGQPLGNAGEDQVSIAYAHTIEVFGKRDKRVAIALQTIKVAQAERDERKRQLGFAVKSAYAEAIAERLKLDTLDRIVKSNQEYYELTQARVKEGDAAPLEARLLHTELSRDNAQRTLTAGKMTSAILNLKSTLDLPAAQDLALPATLSTADVLSNLEHLKSLAVQNRPDLRTLEVYEQQSAAETAFAGVEAKPNLTVSAQYAHIDSAFGQYGLTQSGALTPIRDHDNTLGIGLAIPLTSSRRNRGNIESAVARQEAAKLRREYLRSVIPNQVEAAYERWRTAKEAVEIFGREVIGQSESNLAVMKQAYSLGELRLVDVLNEQRRLLDTELSYIDAQTELFRSFVALEQAVGGSLQ